MDENDEAIGENEAQNVNIRDEDSGQAIDWSTIFFRLHHYCHLNKFEIFEYTLPQVIDLMQQTGKHIQFEVQVKANPFGLFGGGSSSETDSDSSSEDAEYKEMTEEDINQLARTLGGG